MKNFNMKIVENTQPNNINTSNTTLAVFDRIEKESISPYSRWRFLLEEWSLWVLWGATVIFGALALSITSYITMSATYELYEATHTNFFTFFVSVLPYIWVILFILMTYLAVVELKKTKNGYRYKTIYILGSSMFFSVVIASIFHAIGFGYVFDQILGRRVDMYMSMEKMELRIWQSPESGRLVGFSVPNLTDETTVQDPDMMITFKDDKGTIWQLNANELSDKDLSLLQSERIVRILGIKDDTQVFHPCAVFPWMFEKPMAWSQMEEQRRSFEDRMHNHAKMKQRVIDFKNNRANNQTPTSSQDVEVLIPDDNICMHLKMMGV